jgi:elongation factor Ts
VEIKAQDVKTLREKTGAGMMDCKKALIDAGGDFARAEKLLKELGLAAAQKRMGRTTNEGRIFSKVLADKAALVELTSETDFVARNRDFIELGEKIADLVLHKDEAAARREGEALVADAVGRIKENMSLRRFRRMEVAANELLRDYLHGEGRIGVLVKLAASDPALKQNPKVQEAAFDLALHVAAFAPLFLSRETASPEYIREQEEIFTKQAQSLGKPANVTVGIAKGKLNKHLSEVSLLDQPFVKDQSLTAAKLLDQLGKEVGGKIRVVDYLYFKVGEESA